MANPTYLQALSMENPQLINELKAEFDTLRANSYQNKYPCIYLRNQTNILNGKQHGLAAVPGTGLPAMA